MTMLLFWLIGLLAKTALIFMTWTVPRTWVPGELVTASMMNIHVRDNINSLRSEHFTVQRFRGLWLRTHPDADVAASKVELVRADEIVLSDGTRLIDWGPLSADITASGANGLDTGTEQVSTWYEIHAIAKDDGTKGVLLHRAKDYLLDQQQTTNTAVAEGLRSSSAYTRKAQSFQLATAGPVPFIDVMLARNGSPTGRIWFQLEADSAGRPSGTALASTDKLDVAALSTSAVFIRFPFRTTASLSASTTYHLVAYGDFTISASNFVYWLGNTAGGYASGKAQKFDGAAWADQATDTDQVFKIYVTRNDAALTMPTGYTKSCKTGYVYNNSAGNFVAFTASDNRVKRLTSQAGANDWGTTTATVSTLFSLATLIPPGPVILHGAGLASVAGTAVVAGGVPDAYGATVNAGDFGQIFVNGPVANYAFAIPDIYTEYQGAYAYLSGSGTIHVYILGWTWQS